RPLGIERLPWVGERTLAEMRFKTFWDIGGHARRPGSWQVKLVQSANRQRLIRIKGIAGWLGPAGAFFPEVGALSASRQNAKNSSVFPAHANTGDPNGPVEACPPIRSHAR